MKRRRATLAVIGMASMLGLATAAASAEISNDLSILTETSFSLGDRNRDGRLSAAEYADFQKSEFEMIDHGSDGFVDRDDLHAFFGMMEIAELSALISFRTLAEMDRAAIFALVEKRVDRAMPLFDLNGDRKIARAEFGAVGRILFLRLDRDGDGFVSREEM